MAKLEFIKNSIIVNKLSYEWPIGTILRQIKEDHDGNKSILRRQMRVLGYKQYCGQPGCSICRSSGRTLYGKSGPEISDYCIGIETSESTTYWEEDV